MPARPATILGDRSAEYIPGAWTVTTGNFGAQHTDGAVIATAGSAAALTCPAASDIMASPRCPTSRARGASRGIIYGILLMSRSLNPVKIMRRAVRGTLKGAATTLASLGVVPRARIGRVTDSFRSTIGSLGKPRVMRRYSLRSLLTMPDPLHAVGTFAIGLTGFCNLRCPFCPLTILKESGTGSPAMVKYMEYDLLVRCLNEASAAGVPAVTFTFFGDALLHPRLVDFVSEAKRRNLLVYLHTNGNVFTENRARALIAAGVDQMWFSVDAVTPSIYRELRPGGDIERVTSNFRLLRRERDAQRAAMRLGILCIAQPEHPDEWKGVLREFGPIADFVTVSDMGLWTNDETVKPRYPSCTQPWSVIAIYPDGDVSLCCADAGKNLVVGNIGRERLLDIWHGRAAQEIRRRLLGLSGSPPRVCATCRTAANCPSMADIRAVLPESTAASRVTW
jgi:radical SAM protein with 4Fe4S-binding SPASM domain